MKITIDFDATPDEARKFFGLPDVAPLQETIMSELQAKMTASLASMDPETMWRQWMPGVGMANANAGMDAMRQMWEQAMQAGLSAGKRDPSKE